MKRTGPAVIVGSVVLGLAVGFGVDQLLTAVGRSTFVPGLMLPIFLLVLGATTLALAWRVRRSTRGGPRVNPFFALRVAVLAKAQSILGALLLGFGGGLLLFALSRPISPSGDVLLMIGATALAAVLLVVMALVAERFCTLPHDPDSEDPHDDAVPAG